MTEYDSWKLATPWDDEYETTVYFECKKCEAENDDITVVVAGRSGDVDVECEECGENNVVSFGDE